MKKFIPILIFSVVVSCLLELINWIDHYLVTSLNPFLGNVFIALLILISILIFRIVFRWLKKNISFSPMNLFGMGFLSALTSGLLYVIFVGNSTLDIHLHDTLYVMNRFHMLFIFALFLGLLFSIYYVFQKVARRKLNDVLGYIHFWITFIVGYLIFWTPRYEGLAGMPRRYLDYTPHFYSFQDFESSNHFLSRLAILLSAAQILFIANILYSIFKKTRSHK